MTSAQYQREKRASARRTHGSDYDRLMREAKAEFDRQVVTHATKRAPRKQPRQKCACGAWAMTEVCGTCRYRAKRRKSA